MKVYVGMGANKKALESDKNLKKIKTELAKVTKELESIKLEKEELTKKLEAIKVEMSSKK